MSVSGTVNDQVVGQRRKNDVLIPVVLTALVTALVLAALHLVNGTDYVGRDNDDVMRLVQIRDLMAGQNWFDLTQYRLGLEGGTAMHWSRLIDVPIANLIGFFSMFMDTRQAEAAALFIWPLILLLPLFAGTAIAANHLGGRHAMLVALLLTALFAITHQRFRPGAIDHHNVQLALMALVLAGLTDPRFSRFWFSLAGVSAALAVAIGAETVPVIAVTGVAVAILWAAIGRRANGGTRAFGLTFGATLTACFYTLVAPANYQNVVCDSFSTGFYFLGTVGGGVVFLLAAFFSDKPGPVRFALLGAGGAVMALAAFLTAPQCLQSPLADLDPLLRTLWLDKVAEAQSVVSLALTKPESVGAHFAVPLLALIICGWQAIRSDRRPQYLILMAVIALAFGISLVQVRGSVFANLLAIIPFAALIGEKRAIMHGKKKPGLGLALQFIVLVFISVQIIWSMAGLLVFEGVASAGTAVSNATPPTEKCATQTNLAGLASEPPGVVSAVSNIGSDILRFTPHRVLAAPYHRNQGGMLTQLHIAMATEKEAEAFLRGAGVTLVAFCRTDPEAISLAGGYENSFYAALMNNQVPAYLQPVASDGPVELFRVLP
ncbi:MAG: hypothetical protein NXI27_13650 [Alphaproteobacteria bacterium]|nr:hypothetical protein [Alphaproteobacteria bacterium]